MDLIRDLFGTLVLLCFFFAVVLAGAYTVKAFADDPASSATFPAAIHSKGLF